MKPLRNAWFLLFLIAFNGVVLISNGPFLIHRVLQVPDGLVSTAVHGGHVDYYTYVAFIREAKAGAWQVPALYTSEPARPSAIYAFYILLGKFAAITGLTPTAAYHLVRIAGVEVFALALYALVSEITGPKLAIAGVFLGLLSTPPLRFGNAILWQSEYALQWWYNLDPLFRVDYVPHHQISVAFMLLALRSFLRYSAAYGLRDLIVGMCYAFFSALIFPTPALVLLIGLPAAAGYVSLRSGNWRQGASRAVFTAAVILAFSVLIPVLIIARETMKGFPWSQWTVWDIVHWNRFPDFDRDFVVAGGWLLLLALPSIITALVKPKRVSQVILAVWAILPYILLPFCTALGLAKIRLGFLVNYIPLGILTVQTASGLLGRVGAVRVRYVLIATTVAAYGFLNFPTTYQLYREKEARHAYVGPEMFTAPDLEAGMAYFRTEVADHPVVLSPAAVSIMLPSFAPVISYGGHPVHTYRYEEKSYLTARFFDGTLTAGEAADLISRGGITYVLTAETDRPNILRYGLGMAPVSANGSFTVYRVD